MDDMHPTRQSDQQVSQKPSLRSEITWEPKPILKPEVDPDLPELSWPERSAEVLRYSFQRLEYWVSPSGVIREWFRLVFKVFLMLAIPAFLLCPVVTFVFLQVETWTAALLAIVLNLLKTALAVVALGGLIVIAFRTFGGRR